MAPTARREPRRVRSARRRTAFHADRSRKATTPAERYRVAEDALASAAAHASQPARTARKLSADIAEHVRRVLARTAPSSSSTALYEQKLMTPGRDVRRLASALMCLRGAIARLPDTERDRLYEHYAKHFNEEIHRIESERR